MSGKIDPDAEAGEAEIRTDERDRIMLTLAILMLPDHDYLFDQVKSAIERLPPSPLARQPGEDDAARLSASEVACYRWPENTAEHRAMREAFCDGAAHTVTAPPPHSGREALEAAKEFADDEFSDAVDLNRKNRISKLCDKIDAALALRPESGGRE